MNFLEKTDSLIYEAINKKIRKLSPLDVEQYFKARSTRWKDPKAKFLTENMERIYSNIAALLTHISAMIASLGIILIVFDDSKLTQFFIFLEMIFYTIIV